MIWQTSSVSRLSTTQVKSLLGKSESASLRKISGPERAELESERGTSQYALGLKVMPISPFGRELGGLETRTTLGRSATCLEFRLY
jgi:hypothetical protein